VRRERQGKGRSAPSPAGVISHRRTATGGDRPLAVNVNTHTEIQFPLPCHGHLANHHALPAPSRGGGRRRWKRREVGVIYKYRSTGNASDRGRGCFHPLPRGGDIPSMHYHGRRPPLSRQREHPHRNPVPLPCHGHLANRPTLPAPSRGGGRRPRSGREVGVIYKYRSTGNASDRGRGVPPPPLRG